MSKNKIHPLYSRLQYSNWGYFAVTSSQWFSCKESFVHSSVNDNFTRFLFIGDQDSITSLCAVMKVINEELGVKKCKFNIINNGRNYGIEIDCPFWTDNLIRLDLLVCIYKSVKAKPKAYDDISCIQDFLDIPSRYFRGQRTKKLLQCAHKVEEIFGLQSRYQYQNFLFGGYTTNGLLSALRSLNKTISQRLEDNYNLAIGNK